MSLLLPLFKKYRRRRQQVALSSVHFVCLVAPHPIFRPHPEYLFPLCLLSTCFFLCRSLVDVRKLQVVHSTNIFLCTYMCTHPFYIHMIQKHLLLYIFSLLCTKCTKCCPLFFPLPKYSTEYISSIGSLFFFLCLNILQTIIYMQYWLPDVLLGEKMDGARARRPTLLAEMFWANN